MIFDQFSKLTEHFITTDITEQRVDSTQLMLNIKCAGRLAIAFDVLKQAVKDCPEALLSEALKQILDPTFEKELLYRSAANESKSKLQTVLDFCVELVELAEKHKAIAELSSIILVKLFLGEQALFDKFGLLSLAKSLHPIAYNLLMIRMLPFEGKEIKNIAVM